MLPSTRCCRVAEIESTLMEDGAVNSDRSFSIAPPLAVAALAVALGLAPVASSLPGMTMAEAAEAGIELIPGLVLPPMDPIHGKQLFASKGCVVCHSINDVGGTDAPDIGAASMTETMNPSISPRGCGTIRRA